MINVLDRISYFRKLKGWTEYQLAEESGMTQSTISSWYRKNMVPSLPSLDKICNALGITMAQFFATDEEPIIPTQTQKELLFVCDKLTETQKQELINFIKTL